MSRVYLGYPPEGRAGALVVPPTPHWIETTNSSQAYAKVPDWFKGRAFAEMGS
jgi:hypothetical protein